MDQKGSKRHSDDTRRENQHRLASPFVERLDGLVERWAASLPPHLQQRFRDDLRPFGIEHDRTLDTIEAIWQRREREYAFDESTGLARRQPFQGHLVTLLSVLDRPAIKAVGVLFIDLDNLKRINDTCGHDAGDKALAAVGTIIRESLRVDRHEDFVAQADTEDYSAARHGGDEFLVALELRDMSDIQVVGPRLKQRVDDPQRQRARGYDATVPLTSSVGGVVYELPPVAPAIAVNRLARDLVMAADEQMYESKRDGFVHVAVAKFTDRLEIDRAHALMLS